MCFVVIASCQQTPSKPYANTSVVTEEKSESTYEIYSTDDNLNKLRFDVSNRDVYTNNNRYVASALIPSVDYDTLVKMSVTNSITKITRSYSKYLGQVVTLSGQVGEISELDKSIDLNKNISGDNWHTLLLYVNNPNAKMGITTIDCLFNGDIEKIKPNQNLTVTGVFAGTYQSTNSYGGIVEGLSIVCKGKM